MTDILATLRTPSGGHHIDRHEALADHIAECASRWDLDLAPSTELAREESGFGIEIGP